MIIDAIMYLTGCNSTRIRTIAFSMLSQLSLIAFKNQIVHAQIKRDTCDPHTVRPSKVKNFICERLQALAAQFQIKFHSRDIQTKYSGLYSILRLSQEPNDQEINDAIDKYIKFVNL